MKLSIGRRSLRLSLILVAATLSLIAGSSTLFADDGPKRDPTGIATGDKTSVVDAAGNSFVPATPDPSAPNYAQQKKRTMTIIKPN
jgi:hypothetical protein